MAFGSSFEGFLRFSLVILPVRAYNATVPSRGTPHFHQIHSKCGNRIRHEKVCPVHGEVSKDEVVSGYEYEKGQYVTFKPEELSRAKAENDKTINIDTFVPPDAVDPVYFSGKTYYLVPAGPAGQHPYAVLREAMTELGRFAVARLVLGGHDETALIRPAGGLLAMTVLHSKAEVKGPATFAGEVGEAKVPAQERELAKSLVGAATAQEFDPSQYKDRYAERITKLVEAKSKGKKVKTPSKHAETPVILNLMDALQQSLGKVRHAPKASHGRRTSARKPARKASRRKTG